MAQTFDKQLKAINCKLDISIYAMENSVMLIACSMINWEHVSRKDMIHQSLRKHVHFAYCPCSLTRLASIDS